MFHRRQTDSRVEDMFVPGLSPEQKELLLQQSLTALQNRTIEQDSLLEKHHQLLIEGNGDLPVLERLRNLETFASTIRFWLRTVAVAIVLQTITFGIASLVYFIKLLPLLDKLANP